MTAPRATLLSRAITIGLAILAAPGCDHDPNTDEGRNPSPQPLDPFLQALDARRGTIEGDAAQAERDAAVQDLIKLAQDSAWGKDDPIEAIIERYPNQILSAVLVESRAATKVKTNPAAELAYLEGIIRGHPNHSVGAKAAELLLRRLRERSVEGFLARCEDWISADPRTRIARIALYERMRHWSSLRHAKDAALDALRFSAYHDDAARRMELQPYLQERLRGAGLHLEAIALSASGDSQDLAAFLLNSIEAGRATALSRRYFESAPDHAEWTAQIATTQAGPERTLALARAGCLQCYAGDIAAAAESFRQFQSGAGDAGGLPDPDHTILPALHLATLHCLLDSATRNAFQNGDPATQERALASIRGVATELAWLGNDRIAKTIVDPAGYLAFATREEEVFRRLKDFKSIARLYESIADHFPQSDEARASRLRAAEVYKEDLRLPVKAAEVYAAIEKAYPGSGEANTAMFKRGVLLLELEQHAAAREAFTTFVTAVPSDARVPGAKFLAAICRSSLGETEESLADIDRIVSEHPASTVAPSALNWAAKTLVALQRYDDAERYLQDLVERYPESDAAQESRGLLEKLRSISDPQ